MFKMEVGLPKFQAKMAAVEVHNPDDILKRFSKLLQTGELSDLTLKVDGQRFRCHRLLLCASSDVLNTMLTSRLWPEGRSDIVVLREDPECAAVFQHFLEYLYTGQVTLEKHNVLPLLTLADKYNVPSLSRSCLNYMVDACCPATLKYILHWLQYAIICSYKNLEEKCMQFITANFDDAVCLADFHQISRDVLIAFLRQDDLVVSSELHLYSAVKRWFEANIDESSEENDDLFYIVMKYIKFPMIPLKELIRLENDSIASHSKFFLQNIFCALKYHTGTKMDFSEDLLKQLKERERFQPRVYVTETWSTEIIVENVSRLAEGEVRGAFFSTPGSYAEIDQSCHHDWHVMFYPRGVVYSDCQMISWMNCLQNPGGKFQTVRLALSTHCQKRRKFRITVLVMGPCANGEEFVFTAKTTDAIFDSDCTLFNYDNIIPYEEVLKKKSPYKINDSIKLKIVIRPEFQQMKA
ncbi:BTB/POZ domain-containing protein 17-like isoform X2 [Mya arenaria]|uniref:BTB/POZ domain-containing protein 17-like isoform X2 n=1 Tax=Mya arenaria TaxID=6604 RepID=UPI0022E6C17F|nr:BTB/POZ domain-containing protein 17-like isoform X2 [Mya arenaria]